VITEKKNYKTLMRTLLTVATADSNKKAQLTQRERATAVHV